MAMLTMNAWCDTKDIIIRSIGKSKGKVHPETDHEDPEGK
jgi:hypothetical protein